MTVRLAMPMYTLQKIYWLMAAFFFAAVLVSLAIAAILAFYTSKLLSRPLEALKEATTQISQGDYAISPAVLDEPEFAELSNGLVKLSKALDEHMSALKRGNMQLTSVLSSIAEGLIALDGSGRLLFINDIACHLLEIAPSEELIGKQASSLINIKALNELADDCIGEHRSITAEIALPWNNPVLLQASASPMQGASGCLLLLVDVSQLRKLEHMRRDFVANVTHELRTPLTSIRGYVETLQSGAVASPELSAKFLQIIEIEAERLSNLIGDLLYLSEIENNNLDTAIRRFRLSSVAASVVDMLEFTAAARKININCTIDDSIFLEANPDRIKQLLLNLADNAVKYNQEGGTVIISAEKTHALVRISVTDTGIGISEEHISRIFERFYRVDKGRSRSMGGTGLGLSIIKHIVDLYRGNIRLISELGRGSEFIIELPLRYEAKKKN